ncbi:MAG TPA: hypothetical protein VK518_07525 [Puia sp.]|nr:hypothetical protein [Puia sp.]
MPEKQQYIISVSKETSLATFRDIRNNEQAIESFTQTPAAGQPGADEKARLCPHELFILFTAGIIMEKVVFTR